VKKMKWRVILGKRRGRGREGSDGGEEGGREGRREGAVRRMSCHP